MLKTRSAKKRLKQFVNHVASYTLVNPWALEAQATVKELYLLEREQQKKAQRQDGAR
jgi:hypothetical protein